MFDETIFSYIYCFRSILKNMASFEDNFGKQHPLISEWRSELHWGLFGFLFVFFVVLALINIWLRKKGKERQQK